MIANKKTTLFAPEYLNPSLKKGKGRFPDGMTGDLFKSLVSDEIRLDAIVEWKCGTFL
jgi:hypothetical protein